MPVLYTPHFAQFSDADGTPLAGGKLYTYAAGTTTPKATYTTQAGSVQNTNPIVLDSAGRATLFIDGSYRFDLLDANDVPIESTDNVTSFTATGTASNSYYESFSGDGTTKEFTLSENLGTDEKTVMVFTEYEHAINGAFASDTGWTKGAGWTIGSGVATATGAISTAIEQSAGKTLIEGDLYLVGYTVTRSAGTITASVGGTAGTGRSASGTYYETIIAGSSQVLAFTGSGFTGTIDNVSVSKVGSWGILPTSEYTVNGTTLTLTVPPVSGVGNVQVRMPLKDAGAASAAAAAAATSQGAAAASALAAAAAETSILTDAGFIAVSGDLLGADTIGTVAGMAADVTALAAVAADITTVATTIVPADLAAVAAVDTEVAALGALTTEITALGALTTQITTLGALGTEITALGALDTELVALGAITADIETCADNIGDIQDVADALAASIASGIGYDNATSGLTATDVQAAVDELASEKLDAIFATEEEAEAGTAEDKPMNALRTKQAIEALAGGGGWVPIKTITANNDATIDFVNGSGGVVLDGTYKVYAVVISDLVPVTDTTDLYLRTSTNAGSTYDATAGNYSHHIDELITGTATYSGSTASLSHMIIAKSMGTGAGEAYNLTIFAYSPAGTNNTAFGWSYVGTNRNAVMQRGNGGGIRISAADVDAIRFLMSSGNIASGTFTLYGLAGA
jgi:hypothetical protein